MTSVEPSHHVPTVSLVVSTLGRAAELLRLLGSLEHSTFRDFEVIVVDQNADERVAAALSARCWPFAIRHHRAPAMRGLSRGRNFGWRQATGTFVLFPDDDCWYPDWFLARALETMRREDVSVVAGRASDEAGNPINARYEVTAQEITRRNVFTTQIEWVVLFRRSVLLDISGYDETLGVGSDTPWQSYEGPDIMLRALAAGHRAFFDPALYAFHEDYADRVVDATLRSKDRAYARGMGRVMRRHNYGIQDAAFWIGRAALGAAVNMHKPARSMLYVNRAIGRAEGYFLESVRPL